MRRGWTRTTLRSRLSKTKQKLVIEYLNLVHVLARYFVQNRPVWQRGVYVDDLEGEGFLALTKAARTYDPKRLPYPKAYFARAILNGMLKFIKKATRTPRENRVSLQEAAEQMPEYDELDHLRLAIESLPGEDQELAVDRFINGQTLRTLAEGHQIPIRMASMRAARCAKNLSASLDIRLSPRDTTGTRRSGGSSRGPCARPASSRSGGKAPR